MGVDGTERSRDALALAERLAGVGGERLLVAHVHNYGQLEDLLPGREYDASETRLVAGRSPAAGLHDLALSETASLIVLGSSHRPTMGRVQPGGVGQRLLAGAPIPVVLAPLGYAESARRREVVGCAFAGSINRSGRSTGPPRWPGARVRRSA